MNQLKLTIVATLVLFSGPAMADSFEVAQRMGMVIGSEKYCGLSYRQTAIQEFIEKNVAADDLDFPTNLRGATTLTMFSNKSQSASAKTAHCAQVKRLAEAYGFVD